MSQQSPDLRGCVCARDESCSILLLSLPGPGEELVPYDSKEHQMAPSESATSHGSSS